MEKAMLLAANIDFTEDEAVMFWPAYNEYELELGKWYSRRFDLLKITWPRKRHSRTTEPAVWLTMFSQRRESARN
jgi:hypothetical protein